MQAPIPVESGWTLVEPLRALIGVAVLCLIAWAFSSNRRRVPWRVVIGGLGLQLALAGLILGVPATAAAFEWLARQVATAIGMADAGSAFLFGPLAAPDGPAGFVFAFRVLPVDVKLQLPEEHARQKKQETSEGTKSVRLCVTVDGGGWVEVRACVCDA